MDEYENLDLIGSARVDSVIYDLAPGPTGKKGRPAVHGRKLSIQDDFTLSDEKIGDYYMAVRRVLTNIFGRREVMAVLTHDWVEISDGTNKKECISYSFLFAMIFLIFRYLCYN